MQFVPDLWKTGPRVNDTLRATLELEDRLGEDGMRKLEAEELQRFGRILSAGERLYVQQEDVQNKNPSAKSDITVVAPLEMKQRMSKTLQEESNRDRKRCTPCCAAAIGLKLFPPVLLVAGFMAWWDSHTRRIPNRQRMLSHFAAMILPGVMVIVPGSAALTHTLHTERPLPEGNLIRGMIAFFLAGFSTTVLPCAAYYGVRHVLMRPKNVSAARYYESRVAGKTVPLVGHQFIGFYKPLDQMSCVDYGLFCAMYAVMIPVSFVAFLLWKDGDAFLLRQGDWMATACSPQKLQDELMRMRSDQSALAEASYPTGSSQPGVPPRHKASDA
eukprot:TRINITY_DN57662_c0_g1_i1.p1 TRINITY_DN57662_c0_g1~~TRINITY_DN57662_c0_g1_i1.p1  ORF type:complete len:329 (+),score=73.82 TRINITY_DN57662_c0_g1_i1:71-1057(+)